MQFEAKHIFHIYNQGNNRQHIFFCRNNYLFFLTKIKTHIVPYCDILAWCLMPNHFHLMVYVNHESIPLTYSGYSERDSDSHYSERDFESHSESWDTGHKYDCTLEKSIGILLASYTRAINKQENRTGSLFRAKTKAQCLTQIDKITPAYYNTAFGTSIHIEDPDKSYPQVCFNYIHNNPVVAGLVKRPEQWEYSSAQDYLHVRQGTLIHRERAKEFELQMK